MITIPIYDLLILPNVTFFLKKDMFPNQEITSENMGENVLFLMLRTEKEINELTPADFYPVGISGRIENIDSNGSVKIRTSMRVDIFDVEIDEESIAASSVPSLEIEDFPATEEKERFEQIRKYLLRFTRNSQGEAWAGKFILSWKNIYEIVCALSGYLKMTWDEKYLLVSTASRRRRFELAEQTVYELVEMFQVSEEAQSAQKETNENSYRESALKKQIDFLQKQLDEMHSENSSDVRRFETKIAESGMNDEARREAIKVLNRMKQEGKDSHEYGLLYEYLDFLTSLSWETSEMPEIDLLEAENILDEDHYGLRKVKERIIQQLAVMMLNKNQAGSILLFAGAPGTGKTSLGQSIARALKRPYVRISLGGIRDEAEIRGHRRTYVGAMPGRIMEGVKRSGAQNPVIILDEVDKLARDYGGDPANALLEVLDPEQNYNFTDHYLNVPYDLSNVLFVCTANSTSTISEPLLNRMEVIQFPGYTPVEKFHIAKRYLLPKAMQSMGIRPENLEVTDEAIEKIIEEYTAESGVRGLRKQMDILCRTVAVKLVKGEQKRITIHAQKVSEFLGNRGRPHEKILEEGIPGVATGLAWTNAGGEILFVETAFTKGNGKVHLTGCLGEVLKESAEVAITLIKSLYPDQAERFEKEDLHIHVPSGAVPKDGPSAGITLTAALASLVTDKALIPEIAMTGEVSIRGTIIPVGGLPEKLMAAQRAGIRKVLIPYDNVDDLDDVAQEIKQKLEIIPVKRIDEVLRQIWK